jgi:hypothetical protein
MEPLNDPIPDSLYGAAAESGFRPLSATQRRSLEDLLQIGLDSVRVVYTPAPGGRAGASAGTHVWIDSTRPASEQAWLVAHECAHVAQLAAGRTVGLSRIDEHDARRTVLEREADAVADAVCAGRRVTHYGGLTLPREPTLAGPVLWHDSFEHHTLGDLPTDDIVAIVGNQANRTQIVNQRVTLLSLWITSPTSVTEAQITAICPWIRTVRLQASGLLVTYGELNALPDYIAEGQDADQIDAGVLLPILQFIRQQTYNEFQKMLGQGGSTTFQYAVYGPGIPFFGFLNKILESQAVDELTADLGYRNTDHYLAVLTRNACHFAPFSWFRWRDSHQTARTLAAQAYASNDPSTKAQLTHDAWVYVGYADHFLQDSFAAGHLVNKTLIMQWFVEWAAGQPSPIADWDEVKMSTTQLQPGLAGRVLYQPGYAGESNDPQTAEDQDSYAARMARTAVQANQGLSVDAAYQNYLVFLSSLITQSASAAIHDYYNDNSLTVASAACTTPYEIWGDDTFFTGANGSEGARETSATTQMSQEAINEILSNGSTSISVDDIRSHFPTQVQSGGQLIGIEQWNDTQKAFCAEYIFPSLHNFIVRLASPRAYNVSRDQDLGVEWSTSLPNTGFTVTSVTQLPVAAFAASAGTVFKLDPETGAVLGSTSVGADEVRLANDGTSVYAGCDGAVARIAADGNSRVWSTALPSASGVVDVVVDGTRLFASSNGYLYLVDTGSGAVINKTMFASIWGTGDYTANLLVVGGDVIVGSHGYVYRYAGDTLNQRWECSLSGAGYQQVDVAIVGGTILAGTNGSIYTVDAGSGAQRTGYQVTSPVGVGDYTTQVATDGTTAFVGVHGYVYGVSLANPTATAWTCSLPNARYTVVSVDFEGGRLYAGSYGYLFRLDPSTGQLVRSMQPTSSLGVGDYTTRIAPSLDGRAIVGIHGYAYGVTFLDI